MSGAKRWPGREVPAVMASKGVIPNLTKLRSSYHVEAPWISSGSPLSVPATSTGTGAVTTVDGHTWVAAMDYSTGKRVLFGQEGAIASMTAAGSAANGFLMDSDWTPPGTNSNSKSFVTAYTKAYGVAPIEFSAEGYDALEWAAHAIKNAGSTTPSKVTSAMTALGKSSYDGVLSSDIKVTKGQEYSPGLLVQWESGSWHIIKP